MAHTQVGEKWEGPRDPTKEAHIQAAIHDTLTGVYSSFRSAAKAHKVSTPSVILMLTQFSFRCPHRLYGIVLQAIAALRNHCSMNPKKRYWWTGATITQTQPPLFIPANSVLKYLRTFDGPLKSYKRKEDLEALAGALGLSRDRKIADLSARIAAHLQDPGTRQSLADNPRFSALYGLKRRGNCGRRDITASSTESLTRTPSASTSLPPAANNVFPPHMPVFSQIQGSIPYSNHWPGQHHIGAGFSPTAPSPVASTSSQSLPSGHLNNDDSLYHSGNLQYIF
jgi:hypothetical protein